MCSLQKRYRHGVVGIHRYAVINNDELKVEWASDRSDNDIRKWEVRNCALFVKVLLPWSDRYIMKNPVSDCTSPLVLTSPMHDCCKRFSSRHVMEKNTDSWYVKDNTWVSEEVVHLYWQSPTCVYCESYQWSLEDVCRLLPSNKWTKRRCNSSKHCILKPMML